MKKLYAARSPVMTQSDQLEKANIIIEKVNHLLKSKDFGQSTVTMEIPVSKPCDDICTILRTHYQKAGWKYMGFETKWPNTQVLLTRKENESDTTDNQTSN